MLVLEDELLLRKQVAAVLEQHEADVTAVGTVDEARRMIASLPFDFALLDVNLPDGLGTDLLSDGVFSPNTAVVICTAEGGVQGAVEAIRNGAQDYLQKPVDPNVLPAVTTMISKALPDPAKTSPLEASVAYGGMLAGMGGVRGLRGHSLKRIHGLPPATAAGVPDPASLPILGTEGAMFSIPGGVYPGPAVGAKADDQQAGAKDGKGGGD